MRTLDADRVCGAWCPHLLSASTVRIAGGSTPTSGFALRLQIITTPVSGCALNPPRGGLCGGWRAVRPPADFEFAFQPCGLPAASPRGKSPPAPRVGNPFFSSLPLLERHTLATLACGCRYRNNCFNSLRESRTSNRIRFALLFAFLLTQKVEKGVAHALRAGTCGAAPPTTKNRHLGASAAWAAVFAVAPPRSIHACALTKPKPPPAENFAMFPLTYTS